LETTFTYFRSSINEFNIDWLSKPFEGLWHNTLPECNVPLDWTLDSPFDHYEVFGQQPVPLETTHGVDAFLTQVEVGRAVLAFRVLQVLADALDAFVTLGPVVETFLACTRLGPQDAGRMPCSDAADFAQAFVRLARQLFGVPPGYDSLEPLTGGDRDGVEDLVGLEDTVDGQHLFEQRVGEVDLLGHTAAVDLDFHHVRFLLAVDVLLCSLVVHLFQIGVSDYSDNCSFLFERS